MCYTLCNLNNALTEMSFESQQSRIFLQEYLMNQLVSTRNVYVKTKVRVCSLWSYKVLNTCKNFGI